MEKGRRQTRNLLASSSANNFMANTTAGTTATPGTSENQYASSGGGGRKKAFPRVGAPLTSNSSTRGHADVITIELNSSGAVGGLIQPEPVTFMNESDVLQEESVIDDDLEDMGLTISN